MLAPALIYVALNAGAPETIRGWAIPTALAIIDDLVAVAIIAAFYTADLALAWLGLAGLMLVALVGLNRTGIERLAPYLALGAVLWFFVLKSGVHATLSSNSLIVLRMAMALCVEL